MSRCSWGPPAHAFLLFFQKNTSIREEPKVLLFFYSITTDALCCSQPQRLHTSARLSQPASVYHRRLLQEAEIASLPFVDRVCPHRKVDGIIDELPSDADILVHCKVGLVVQEVGVFSLAYEPLEAQCPLAWF